MFNTYTCMGDGKSEAIFVTLYNKVDWVSGSNFHKYNNWEHSVRPKNAKGTGMNPTSEIVDLFPMADGKKNGESIYTYDTQCFYLNRDPRFYRTFTFPGIHWAFNGDPTPQSNPAGEQGQVFPYPYNGENYELWNYCWYDKEEEQDDTNKSGFAADGFEGSNNGVYINKRSDDLDVNTSPLYTYQLTAASNGAPSGFKQSGAPYMEIRYAEVLLNMAEAACGTEDPALMEEAYNALTRIRSRVYPNDLAPDYGLNPAIKTSRAQLFAAILYERQIELAYEGKRFDDMRRWMLWDGGEGQESLKASWKVTGFGGNTCQYLGVKPLNGTRRHSIEIYTKVGTAARENGKDPLLAKLQSEGKSRPAALNLTKVDLTAVPGEDPTDSNVKALTDFYRQYFNRKDRNADGNSVENVITFQPKYYFIGFKQNMMQNNTKIEQTIGWGDINKGGADGTFDPLAE